MLIRNGILNFCLDSTTYEPEPLHFKPLLLRLGHLILCGTGGSKGLCPAVDGTAEQTATMSLPFKLWMKFIHYMYKELYLKGETACLCMYVCCVSDEE